MLKKVAMTPVLSALCLAAACGGGGGGGGAEGETGSSDVDDQSCSVRLAWGPGVGDVTSYPTAEMVVEDATRASGYAVTVSVENFPGLEAYGSYAAQISEAASNLDGFGTSAEVFVGMTAAMDASLLPAPTGGADPTTPGGFVVMPADGAAYLISAKFDLTDEGRTLMAFPEFPLPPGQEVALYLTRDFAAASGDCLGASDGMRGILSDPGSSSGPAVDALIALGVVASADELAVVHAYPVQSATLESEAIASYIQGLSDADVALTNQSCTTGTQFRSCTATLAAGDFRNADNHVDIDLDAVAPNENWELTVYAYLPLEVSGPMPTILFGHGLTGTGEQAQYLAESAAPRGIAVVALDAVEHGLHPSLMGSKPSGLAALLAFFAADVAAMNIDALRLRDHFRQSTYDKLFLTRALLAGADLDGDGGGDVDPDQLAYLGVSLGAIMGVEFLSMTGAYNGGVLVMPGARLTSVMTDPAGSFEQVLGALIPSGYTDGDTRRLFAMLQTVLDGADPATYGGQVVASRFAHAGDAPDLLMAAVLDDDTVVNAANWAAARSMKLDIVPPTLRPVSGLGETASAPIAGNMNGVTAGLLQFDVTESGPATHTSLSFSEVGTTAWWGFLDPLFESGQGEIIDPYAAIGLDHAG